MASVGFAANATGAADPALAICLAPTAGAPSCSTSGSVGSSATPGDLNRQVGNPIDIASGNKYQREVDYRAVGSGLALIRHYNSSLRDHDLGLGPGWRHGYHVNLMRVSDTRLQIVQSDGRLLLFELAPRTSRKRDVVDAGDEEHPDMIKQVYHGIHATDGVIVLDEDARWHLADGRTLYFNGSFLVKIDFADQRGTLSLHYRHRRLHTVTDSVGHVLEFNYVARPDVLPRYGTGEALMPIGALKSVTLPDGSLVQYRYDANRNPVGVSFDDGTSITYDHDDLIDSRLLTSRTTTADGWQSEWGYDENGRATSWRERRGIDALSIRRNDATERNPGTASVTWLDGRSQRFVWPHDNAAKGSPLHSPQVANLEPGVECIGCYPASTLGEPDESVLDVPSQTDGNRKGRGGPMSSDDTRERLLDSLSGSLELNPDDARLHGRAAIRERSVPVVLKADRQGHIIYFEFGKTDVGALATKWVLGELPSCRAMEIRVDSPEARDQRLIELADGAPACATDALTMIRVQQLIEAHYRDGASPDIRYNRNNPRRPRPRPPPPDPFCTMPIGKSCSDLEEDYRMAELANCAYAGIACPSGWALVAPGQIGLGAAAFSDNGFDAILLYSAAEDRYVLSFRGTDNVGDDWDTNIAQGQGEPARQYDLALALAMDITTVLPSEDISYTGHSLGGGLATFAAIATHREATVFNSAALHHATAQRAGLIVEYAIASQSVDVVYTASDPITAGSNFMATSGAYEASEAPGLHAEIPDPPESWVDARPHQWWDPTDRATHFHSMAAVLESLDMLLVRHCGRTP